MDPTFALMATHKAAIFAPPPVSAGKRGDAVLLMADLACLPFDMVSAQGASRLGLEAAVKLRQTFLDGKHVIPRGSYLTLDGLPQRYPIKATEPWDWEGTGNDAQYTHLILEAVEA